MGGGEEKEGLSFDRILFLCVWFAKSELKYTLCNFCAIFCVPRCHKVRIELESTIILMCQLL